MIRRMTALVGAGAIAAMGALTVSCSPRTEKPSDAPVSVNPTEKTVRTNVTRNPNSFAPPIRRSSGNSGCGTAGHLCDGHD